MRQLRLKSLTRGEVAVHSQTWQCRVVIAERSSFARRPTGVAADRSRRTVRRFGIAFGVAAVTVSACTSADRSSATTASTSVPSSSTSVLEIPPTSPPAPVPIASVFESVEFYPACGSETLDHLGVTWYQLVHPGYEAAYPELQERFDEVIAVDRAASPVAGIAGFARVGPPGPGDDIGTLVVWADGVARWVSDSGQLDVWMVDERIVNPWPC